MTQARRDRRTVLDELATATVDLTEVTLRISRLTGELDGIDQENAQLAMLRTEPDAMLIPVKEAARIARLSDEVMKKHCLEQGFGWRRVTTSGRQGHWVVYREDFLEWLKSNRKNPNPSVGRRYS